MDDPNEIPAPEVSPEIPPVENAAPTAPAPVPAPETDDADEADAPPAADLVINGTVTDERALELDRRERALRERETRVAETERLAQEAVDAALNPPPPPPPKPPKVKRSRGWTDPVFDDED